jgi:hypothetical protein
MDPTAAFSCDPKTLGSWMTSATTAEVDAADEVSTPKVAASPSLKIK